MLEQVLHTPKLWTVSIALVLLILVLILGYHFFADSTARRRRIARRLLKRFLDARRADPSRRLSALVDLILDLESPDRFTSCYAAWVLGRLTREFPDTSGSEPARALAELLDSKDPFRRHAAAQALYQIGPRALSQMGPAGESAIALVRRHADRFNQESDIQESSGIIATRLRQRLDDPEAWW